MQLKESFVRQIENEGGCGIENQSLFLKDITNTQSNLYQTTLYYQRTISDIFKTNCLIYARDFCFISRLFLVQFVNDKKEIHDRFVQMVNKRYLVVEKRHL
jgi:hypothetical protein